jgi:hypothetical protein
MNIRIKEILGWGIVLLNSIFGLFLSLDSGMNFLLYTFYFLILICLLGIFYSLYKYFKN